MLAIGFLLCFGLLTAIGAGCEAPPDLADAPLQQQQQSGVVIRNGGFWNDTRGQRIEAHGGGFLQVGDTWYWFGEDKSHNGGGFRGVNCYASRDLAHWEFRRAIITPRTAPELAAADRIIERPKVIYNDRTRTYVMWLHWEGKNYAEAKAGVFTSPTVDGPYTFRSAFRPFNNMARDDTLFKDDDGKAYFVAAARENADLIVYQLTDDYLGVARQLVTLWPGSYREAPAVFKHAGTYFLVTSGATGWEPNQAKYATARSMQGPWSALRNLGGAITFDTQPTYVLPVRGASTNTFVYAGDRWKDPDLGSSKYIWLPLAVSGTTLSLSFEEAWRLDLQSGAWSPVRDTLIPQQSFRLLSASSEETVKEDARAARAFDGKPETFWHSRYSGGVAQYPHELQIDLGATWLVEGLRYLPRQDNNENGRIGTYTLYLSEDRAAWGVPVVSATFHSGSGAKRVEFPPRRARFMRLVAQREEQGREWASAAELSLIGRAP